VRRLLHPDRRAALRPLVGVSSIAQTRAICFRTSTIARYSSLMP
jgi:hypothetical protein